MVKRRGKRFFVWAAYIGRQKRSQFFLFFFLQKTDETGKQMQIRFRNHQIMVCLALVHFVTTATIRHHAHSRIPAIFIQCADDAEIKKQPLHIDKQWFAHRR